jgi:flagellar motor switch protein FliN
MATQTAPALQEPAETKSAALVAAEPEASGPDGSGPEETVSLAEEIEARLLDAPLQLDVQIPIRDLKVKDVLAIEKGKIFETQWPGDEDVPAGCGGVQLVWTEFEVIEKRLAVRVTRLA